MWPFQKKTKPSRPREPQEWQPQFGPEPPKNSAANNLPPANPNPSWFAQARQWVADKLKAVWQPVSNWMFERTQAEQPRVLRDTATTTVQDLSDTNRFIYMSEELLEEVEAAKKQNKTVPDLAKRIERLWEEPRRDWTDHEKVKIKALEAELRALFTKIEQTKTLETKPYPEHTEQSSKTRSFHP